jgi:hypothetical protein
VNQKEKAAPGAAFSSRVSLPFRGGVSQIHVQQEEQLPQPPLEKAAGRMESPHALWSITTGAMEPASSLSIMKVYPPVSSTTSFPRGSSRARPSWGPPQPGDAKILMDEASLPSKYLSSSVFAEAVSSTFIFFLLCSFSLNPIAL